MSHQDARNWPQMGKENCVLQKAQEFKNNKRENTVKSGRLLWYRLQHHLAEVSGDTKNIWRPTRKGKAHHTRFLFKHVNGISINEGMHVMSETATIGAFQVKTAALVETNNVHWNQSTRDKISHQLWSHLGHSRVVYASNASKRPDDGYQSGCLMMTVVGPQCGRMQRSGSHPWGRFKWTELRGYRVSQKGGAAAGPHTA